MKYAQGTVLEKIIEGGDSMWIYTTDSASVTVIPNNNSSESVTTTVDRTDGTVKYGPYYKPTVIKFTATADEMDVRNYAFSVTPDSDGEFNEIIAATGGMTPQEIGKKLSTGSALGPGYDIILLAGQSNMIGRYGPIDSDLDKASQSVFMYGYNRRVVEIAKNPIDQNGETADTVGLGLNLGKSYAENYLDKGRKVLLIPAAKGGTSFASGFWRTGGDGYDNAVASCNEAVSLPGNNRVVLIAWHQGESDSGMTEAEYSAELDALISGFRSDIATASEAPFVCAGISESSSGFGQGVLNATLVRQLSDNNSGFVYVNDLALGADSLHFSAASEREMGLRYSSALRYIPQLATIDFSNDTVGSEPVGIVDREPGANASAVIVNTGVAEFSGNYLGFSSSTGISCFTVDSAPIAQNQVVEFRYKAGTGRGGVVLRANTASNKRNGYLLQINGNDNTLKIYKCVSETFTQLGSNVALTVNDYTFYRATVMDDDIKLEYSADGIAWTSGITHTDTTFSGLAGGVDLIVGFSSNANQVHYDDIKIGVAVTD